MNISSGLRNSFYYEKHGNLDSRRVRVLKRGPDAGNGNSFL